MINPHVYVLIYRRRKGIFRIIMINHCPYLILLSKYVLTKILPDMVMVTDDVFSPLYLHYSSACDMEADSHLSHEWGIRLPRVENKWHVQARFFDRLKRFFDWQICYGCPACYGSQKSTGLPLVVDSHPRRLQVQG